jgi:ribosome-binding protein aMBF1 (putative translation factor)
MAEPTQERWAEIRARKLADPLARERYERTRRSVLAVREVLQRIQREREKAGLSKADLARRIGANPAAIRRMFTSGSSNPTLKTILELADALDLEIELSPREQGIPARARTLGRSDALLPQSTAI